MPGQPKELGEGSTSFLSCAFTDFVYFRGEVDLDMSFRGELDLDNSFRGEIDPDMFFMGEVDLNMLLHKPPSSIHGFIIPNMLVKSNQRVFR